MTTTADRKRQLTLIHLAKTQLGLDDDTYRAQILRLSAGRTGSAGLLTDSERDALLAEYRAKGWDSTKPYRPRARVLGATRSAQAMLAPIERLLAAQALPVAYAEAILRRQRGLTAGAACPLAMASADELRGVIAALWRRGQRLSVGAN